MALGWSKTRYSPIAVDFGADSLKVLQVIPGQSRRHLPSDPPQLVAAAAAELPEEARKDPSARSVFYGEALKELLASQPFKGRRAICAIPAYQTLIQHLQVTRVDREDYDTQVGLHLRQRLNVDPSRMVIRNYPITQVTRDGSNKHEVICMAASRDSVMRYIEIAHRAKLDVVGMECEPHAILKSFAYLFRRDNDAGRVTCFIDLGAATTKVVIAHGSEMVFAKLVHAAGDHFTRRLAAVQEMSFAEARQLRIDSIAGQEQPREQAAEEPEDERSIANGSSVMAIMNAQMASIGEVPEGGKGGSGSGANTEVATAEPKSRAAPAPAINKAAFNETMDCLIDELQLCSRYYQTIFPDKTIENVVFLGGESRYSENCQAIARSLRIAAQLGDPMARVVKISKSQPATGVDLHQPQPGWAVPMGLCLSEPNL